MTASVAVVWGIVSQATGLNTMDAVKCVVQTCRVNGTGCFRVFWSCRLYVCLSCSPSALRERRRGRHKALADATTDSGAIVRDLALHIHIRLFRGRTEELVEADTRPGRCDGRKLGEVHARSRCGEGGLAKARRVAPRPQAGRRLRHVIVVIILAVRLIKVSGREAPGIHNGVGSHGPAARR